MKKKKQSVVAQSIYKHPFQWAFFLIISIAIVVVCWYFQGRLHQFRRLGLLGIFLINLISSASFLPSPAIATVVAGGALYPPILVALVASFGSVCGNVVGYVVGLSGKKTFIRENGKKYGQFIKLFREYGDIGIFAFALIPNPLFEAVGITAGALNFPLGRFFIITLAGRFLRDILLANFGHRFL